MCTQVPHIYPDEPSTFGPEIPAHGFIVSYSNSSALPDAGRLDFTAFPLLLTRRTHRSTLLNYHTSLLHTVHLSQGVLQLAAPDLYACSTYLNVQNASLPGLDGKGLAPVALLVSRSPITEADLDDDEDDGPEEPGMGCVRRDIAGSSSVR